RPDLTLHSTVQRAEDRVVGSIGMHASRPLFVLFPVTAAAELRIMELLGRRLLWTGDWLFIRTTGRHDRHQTHKGETPCSPHRQSVAHTSVRMAINASGFSSTTLCPDPSMTWSRAEGRRFTIDSAMPRNLASSSPTTRWTGRWRFRSSGHIFGMLDRPRTSM